MIRYLFCLVPVVMSLCGCGPTLAVQLPERDAGAASVANDRYDPSACGSVSGTVRWTGAVPKVEPVQVVRFRMDEPLSSDYYPHPNAPGVSAAGELSSAIVLLDGIDPRRSRPMEPITVEVELEPSGLSILRDGRRYRVAGVPVGSRVRVANRLDGIGGIRARGAEFFAQMFPDRDRSVVRTFPKPGRTTVTSASGQYWAVADLFALQHPYVANPDDHGRFRFDQVPDGEYELMAWHANWHVVGHELDPETGVMARQTYGQPVEKRSKVQVRAGSVTEVNLAFSLTDFGVR